MPARALDLASRLGVRLPEPPRALIVFGAALFFEVVAMVLCSAAGWRPLPLDRDPVLLVIDAAVAAALVELLLRGVLQGLVWWFGSGAVLSLLLPAAAEYLAGYTRSEVLWEGIFGVGYVFARAASGSVYPGIAVRFLQYLLIPAFSALHR